MIEKEYKLLLSEEQYKQIDSYFKWDNEFYQTNYYYNDQDNYIINKKITVRIRERNNLLYLQVKIPQETINSLNIKEEKGIKVHKILNPIPQSLVKELLNKDLQNVRQIGALKTYRKLNNSFLSDVKICLDKNEYLNLIDYELELEFSSEELPTNFQNIFEKLFNINFLQISVGKNSRFLRELSRSSQQ